MSHPVIAKGNVAVITGGASGIGLAAAMAFARAGMKVCIADVDEDRLAEAATKLSSIAGAANVMTSAVDVIRIDSLTELERAVGAHFGGTDLLMNNAGIQPGSTLFGEPDHWQRIIGVNMWGIIKMLVDLLLSYDDGKYVIARDGAKPIVRIYAVPNNTFDDESDEDDVELQNENDSDESD